MEDTTTCKFSDSKLIYNKKGCLNKHPFLLYIIISDYSIGIIVTRVLLPAFKNSFIKPVIFSGV